MSEPEVRIGNMTHKKYTVLARHTDSDGEAWVWLWREGSNTPTTETHIWLMGHTRPLPGFFEENKTYHHPNEGVQAVTIWRLLDLDGSKVAVGKRTDGTIRMFTQPEWDSGTWTVR